MKKSNKIIISILVLLLLIGLFVAMYFIIFKKEDEIKSLDIINQNIVMEVGDTKDLKECFVVSPSNAGIYVMCYVNDASFAEINNDNIILAKSEGETKILIKCKVKNKIVEKEISLQILERKILPSSFTFTNSIVTIGKNTKNFTNSIICSEEYNVSPVIEYSNPNICEYNYINGLITPLNVGSTNVTVKFIKGKTTISNSFVVNIEENHKTIETNLTKEDEYYILLLSKDTVGHFSLKTYENGVENDFKLKFDFITNEINTNIIQFESNMVLLTASQKGEAILKISLEDDESIFIEIRIKVV